MHIVLDLKRCEDHAQCVYAAPQVFSLDERGLQAFRAVATSEYTSGELDDALRGEIEEAADVCPVQAIEVVG
jgi:ferredoxin